MIEKNKIRRVLLADISATDNGHLLNDDLFLAECILPITDEFAVATSPVSAEQIKKKLNIKTHVIKPAYEHKRFPRLLLTEKILTLQCSRYSDIIFQSFEEISTLLFMLLYPNKHVHLIVTNNLRQDRFKRHPILLRYLLNVVFNRVSSVIVHSQYEQNLIINIAPNISLLKIYIKPFHQFSFNRKRLKWIEKSRNILFIGPEQDHKRLDVVCDLIRRDKEKRYHYIICSMRDNLSHQTKSFLERRENVELLYGYIMDNEYYDYITKATLVILTHDLDYEGALSGVFCDAVASGTPVIARRMAPNDEFFERFGPMGFLVDYSDPEWVHCLLNTDELSEKYDEFQQNMAACREWCSMDSNRDIFNSILTR